MLFWGVEGCGGGIEPTDIQIDLLPFIYWLLSEALHTVNSIQPYRCVTPLKFFSMGSFPRQSGQTNIITSCLLLFVLFYTNLVTLLEYLLCFCYLRKNIKRDNLNIFVWPICLVKEQIKKNLRDFTVR